MPDYKQLFENNRQWAEATKAKDSSFFSHLAKEQRPDYLFITCSDSRVGPELITKAKPGEMFVHRNIANQVFPDDLSVMSVLNFAVLFLEVKHVVVCGHYGCGGVMAAEDDKDYGELNPWLKQIKHIKEKYRDELLSLSDLDERHKKLVEYNVLEQCENIRQSSSYEKAGKRGLAPQIHGWVYDMETGCLKEL